VRADALRLTNCDLDSGKVTQAGEYTLADDSYAKLLHQLAEHKFQGLTPELRDNILRFYSSQTAAIHTKKDESKWKNVQADLEQLKTAPIAATVPDSPRGDVKVETGTQQVCSATQVTTTNTAGSSN
jgi:hypothetical protein